MTKSTMKNQKPTTVDSRYYEAVENLWKASLDMLTYSSNTLGEIYRISSIVRLFARNKAKIDALRKLCGEASEKNDVYALKRVAFLAERQQEEKTFDCLWEMVARQYDDIIKSFIEQQQNDNIILEIPTSEEILENSVKYLEESNENEVKRLAETAKALINL